MGRRGRERQPHVGLECRRRGACQPLSRYRSPQRLATLEAVEIERHLQPVGHDRLDSQMASEAQLTQDGLRRPIAGGRISRRLDIEAIKALGWRRISRALHEPAAWVIQLESDRMTRGERAALVLQNERQVHRVARSPDTPVPIEEAFHSLGHRLPAHIEVARGQRIADVELEIAALLSGLTHQQERCACGSQRGQAVSIRARRRQSAVLEVADNELDAGSRRARAQVGGAHEKAPALIALGQQTDVRGYQVALRTRALVIGEVRRIARVGAIRPPRLACVEVLLGIVPVGRLLLVPVFLVAQRGLRGRRLLARLLARARVGGIARRQLQGELEHPARVFAHQLGDIEVVTRPVPGGRRSERYRPAPQKTPDSPHLGSPVQLVDLQELAHVVVEDTQCGHMYRTRIDRLQRDGECLAIGKDHASAYEAHLRLQLSESQRLTKPLFEPIAAIAADAGLECQGRRALCVVLEIHDDRVPLNVSREAAPRQMYQTCQVLPRIEVA